MRSGAKREVASGSRPQIVECGVQYVHDSLQTPVTVKIGRAQQVREVVIGVTSIQRRNEIRIGFAALSLTE